MDGSNGLTVVCLSTGENFDVTLKTYRWKHRGGFTLDSKCPVVILTFYTGFYAEHTDSKGFYFEWQAVAGSPPFYSSNSKHCVTTTGMMGAIRHPGWGQVYSNNELSTFIFVPQSNLYNSESRMLVTLVPEVMSQELIAKTASMSTNFKRMAHTQNMIRPPRRLPVFAIPEFGTQRRSS
ncbi:hypothetical protein Ocin01_16688 [Orchesella cincta]|uniref:Uncharacterized protein n=1 Tax=Orchesella cincta TaxID=48709 RepID=A0A1D2MAI0_ORCCI|nr:hypothetical protein Ocin01_16688 [Orchesella cincta]